MSGGSNPGDAAHLSGPEMLRISRGADNYGGLPNYGLRPKNSCLLPRCLSPMCQAPRCLAPYCEPPIFLGVPIWNASDFSLHKKPLRAQALGPASPRSLCSAKRSRGAGAGSYRAVPALGVPTWNASGFPYLPFPRCSLAPPSLGPQACDPTLEGSDERGKLRLECGKLWCCPIALC